MMDHIQISSDIEVCHIGPSLDQGVLPSVFYFALSAQESLSLDPFNQPALFLAQRGLRVFSIHLPAHGPNLSPLKAIQTWADAFSSGQDPLAPFLDRVIVSIEKLKEMDLIHKDKLALMGLSRGGLIAGLIGAQIQTSAIAAFAPMVTLTSAKEFTSLDHLPAVEKYSLSQYLETLCEKKLRIYIGNRDIRVGTDLCFSLVKDLADAAFEKGIRSPPVEMIISPSIGHMGHGTPKETFEAGAQWIITCLGESA